jgi:SH3-like domain-containing protein
MKRAGTQLFLLALLLIAAPAFGQKPPAAKPVPAPAPQPALPPLPPAAVMPTEGSSTHEKLPRFASLRFDDVNLRVGPGTNYPIDWVYHRRNLPVEIVFELGDWRQIKDRDGVTGWVRGPSLWKRRSVMVGADEIALRASADDTASPVAMLKPGVIAHVRSCPSGSAWCEVEIDAYRGWLKRAQVYGVYPDETVGGD